MSSEVLVDHDGGTGGLGMDTVPSGWRVETHRLLPSTQEHLEELMSRAPADRVVIVAGEQSAGRGRRGQRWESPRGGLWCSLSLAHRPRLDPFLGLVVALAARNAVAALLPAADSLLRIRWPNDLVAGGRKWGGVLCTTHASNDRWNLLFGVGLNLEVPATALPATEPPATSIAVSFGRSPSPVAVLPRILSALDALLALDSSAGRERMRTMLSPYVDSLGRSIEWREELPSGTPCRGVAEMIDTEGALRVRRQDGSEVTLRNGPVHHVRVLP